MRYRRMAALAAMSIGAVTAAVPLAAGPAQAVSEPEVIAEGLNNPYKLSFGPDGGLYVAESGLGGEGPCLPAGDMGDSLCYGATGSITRIDVEEGGQERVAEGLPSIAAQGGDGSGAIGPTGVTVADDGTIYVAVGLGAEPAARDALGEQVAGLGTITAVNAEGEQTIFADLAGFEGENNPDADQPDAEADSNPFDVELTPDGLLAADAGGNDILAIDGDGGISVAALLPYGEADAPPFLGLPPGTRIPFQPVPTAVSVGPRGTLVGELTGFPFPVGEADVFELGADEPAVVEPGFSAVVDIAQGADGSLYVLEFASNGLLAAEGGEGPPLSRLIQVRPDGTRKVLLQDDLFLPNGVTVGPDGMVYVTNGSQLAGGGTVIRVDPSVARDPATAAACDPVDVPGGGFADVGGSVHREAIDCLAWYGIVEGVGEGAFGPLAPVDRAQVASIVVRTLQAAGFSFPANPADAFTDDEGSVHEDAVNQLAAIDVVLGQGGGRFGPDLPVSRGELASILARAYEALTGAPLPPGDAGFSDTAGSVHEDAIEAVAGAGWVVGRTDGTFGPALPTLRSQLASMIARTLGTLATDGLVESPAEG